MQWADEHLARCFTALSQIAKRHPGCLPCVIDVSLARRGGPCEDLAPALGAFVETVVPGVKLGPFALDATMVQWLREEDLEPFEPAEGCFLALALGPHGPALVELAIDAPMMKGGAA